MRRWYVYLVKIGCVNLILKHGVRGGGEAEKKCDSFDGRMDIGQ
jgi:hypothetical protein